MEGSVLQTLQRRLLNISAGNKALLHLRILKSSDVDLTELDYVHQKPAQQLLEQLLFTNKGVAICPVFDSRSAEISALSTRLGKIARQAELIQTETGIYNLYIGLWYATGFLNENTAVRAPVLLIPVRLYIEHHQRKLRRDEAEPPFINPVLLLAYSHQHKCALPDALMQWSLADEPDIHDMIALKTSVYQLFRDAQIEINFRDTFFETALEPFTHHNRESFQRSYQHAGLSVHRSAVLSIYTGIDSALQTDFDQLIREGVTVPQLFQNKEGNHEVRLEDCYTPYPFDSYQLQTIRRIKQGASLVVQGPPGTGKSQLLANIAADAMASGKRVLIVCQKKAALDVIYKRLAELQLHDFAALVHDHRHERKDIYLKISQQITHIERYVQANKQLDTVVAERAYIQASRQAAHILAHLEGFRKALYENSQFGPSALELYQSIDTKPLPIQDELWLQWDATTLAAMKRAINRALELRKNHATALEQTRWRNSFAELQPTDKASLLAYLNDIPMHLHHIQLSWPALFTQFTAEQARKIVQTLLPHIHLLTEWKNWAATPAHYKLWQTFLSQSTIATEAQKHLQIWLAGNAARQAVYSHFDSKQIAWHLQQVHQIVKIHKQWTGRWLWPLKARKYTSTLQFLEANYISYTHWPDTAQKLQAWLDQSAAYHWFLLHTGVDLQTLPNPAEAINKAAHYSTHFQNLLSAAGILLNTEALEAWLQLVCNQTLPLQKIFSYPVGFNDAWLQQLASTPELIPNTVATIQHHFDSLVAIDQIWYSLPEACRAHVLQLEQLRDLDSREKVTLYENTVKQYWLWHIEKQNPVLKEVSTGLMLQNIHELHQLMDERQQLLPDIIRLKAQEHACRIVQYNRLNNRITYRELLHQTTKKKRIWPVRQLISQFESEIFQLMPVWLCSPESAAAIFEMRPFFDLVLFDEASQCFAEKALPIIYRSGQVVVVGDDQQLQPFDLYQIRYDDDEPDSSTEAESLLKLASLFLPATILANHYRSKAPELIAFSNKHFYQNQLVCLPHYQWLKSGLNAFEFIHVPGTWHNHTNRKEAEHVVQHVISLLPSLHNQVSVCVATFNYPQSELIKEMLEYELSQQDVPWPATLIVKNIENIQGDEADVLLFSLGYAKDEQGTLRLQFGALSQSGGENRLNVAITRARERIVVFSSIMPHELHTQHATNRGPQLLKEYLEFVYQQAQQPAKESWNVNSPNGEILLEKTGYIKAKLADNVITLTDSTTLLNVPDASEAFYHLPKRLQNLGWQVQWRFSRNTITDTKF